MNTESIRSWFRGASRSPRKTALICAGLAGAGVLALVVIFNTVPTPKRETAVRQTAMLVDVVEVEAGTFRPVIEAMGTVTPERDITLRPRVSGQVVGISENFVPGGYVEAGEVLVRIDEADYRNALQQRESELQQAITDLEIEQGRQVVAAQDYRELGRELPPERKRLVLRQPQLRGARAAVQSAEAAVEQARLNLQRTQIKAPFDAHVLSRNANLGSQVGVGDTLARLVGQETYWVDTAVPVGKVRRLSFAEEDGESGSPVEVRSRASWPEGTFRKGYLYRLIGELDQNTRMARALVAVDDPLARRPESRGQPRLMAGAFVESRITGRELTDTLKLSRDHVRKDDTVWVMEDGKLAIREVEIVFRDAEHAYIQSGLEPGARVVTTNLATVREGVKLRLEESAAASDKPASQDTVAEAQTGSAQQ